MSTPIDRNKLRDLAEAAQRVACGPWHYRTARGDLQTVGVYDANEYMVAEWSYAGRGCLQQAEEDGIVPFVAAVSPSVVLELLDELAALGGEP